MQTDSLSNRSDLSVCLSGGVAQTFENLNTHYERVMRLGALPSDVPVVVIGNKRDQVDRVKIAQEEVLEWMRNTRPDLPESMEYIDTSAKDDVNVEYAFGKAIEMAEKAVIRSRRPDTQHPNVAPEPEPEPARSRSRASTWSTAEVRVAYSRSAR